MKNQNWECIIIVNNNDNTLPTLMNIIKIKEKKIVLAEQICMNNERASL